MSEDPGDRRRPWSFGENFNGDPHEYTKTAVQAAEDFEMILVIAKMMIFWKNKCFCGFQPVALKLRWFWSTFEKEFWKEGKSFITTKIQKNLLPKHHSQLSCCHYITIYDSQLQNTIVFRSHPQQRETLTQPFHCDLQRLSCQAQKTCNTPL